jgi:hypothetical protein
MQITAIEAEVRRAPFVGEACVSLTMEEMGSVSPPTCS